MKLMRVALPGLMGLLCICMAGCEMDDGDRCTDDYVWSKEQAACIAPPDSSAPMVDTDTTPVQPGLGDDCWEDTDCAESGDYNHCLRDPMDETVIGMCTIANCTQESCGGSFQCCDCSMVTILPWDVPYCVDSVSAGLLSAVCTCE